MHAAALTGGRTCASRVSTALLICVGWCLSSALAAAEESAPPAEPADAPVEEEEVRELGVTPVETKHPLPITASAEELRQRRERRHQMHNSFEGTVGGFRVVDAGTGAEKTFRVQALGSAFLVNDWLEPGERHLHMGGQLGWAWTPISSLEIYGRSGSWKDSTYSPDSGHFGLPSSSAIGAKGVHAVLPWLTAGGDVSLMLPINTVIDIPTVIRGTSVGLRANLTADLRERPQPLPLIGRLNLGRVFDNTSSMVSALEQQRLEALAEEGEVPPGGHLLSPMERYGLQVDRVDRYVVGLGVEAPIALDAFGVTVSPIGELVWSLPANRQGFACPEGGDACLDEVGSAAFRRSLLIGTRVLPPLRGLNLFVAAEIGLTGVRTTAHELRAQEPYSLRFGFSYAFDNVTRRGG